MEVPGGFLADTSEIRAFVYWHWAQIQYQNPGVQMLVHEAVFPFAFLRAFFSKMLTMTMLMMMCLRRLNMVLILILIDSSRAR